MGKKFEMSDRYVELTEKFANDKDIYELIELCIQDDLRARERVYITTGRYPEQRNVLMKLKFDLLTVKEGN